MRLKAAAAQRLTARPLAPIVMPLANSPDRGRRRHPQRRSRQCAPPVAEITTPPTRRGRRRGASEAS
eukprot:6945464-Pyramimonas_sp.AAC.1